MKEMDVAECCDRNGALALAERITRYWAMRGMRVHVYLERARHIGVMRSARYDVRSDMVNGTPRAVDEQRDAA